MINASWRQFSIFRWGKFIHVFFQWAFTSHNIMMSPAFFTETALLAILVQHASSLVVTNSFSTFYAPEDALVQLNSQTVNDISLCATLFQDNWALNGYFRQDVATSQCLIGTVDRENVTLAPMGPESIGIMGRQNLVIIGNET